MNPDGIPSSQVVGKHSQNPHEELQAEIIKMQKEVKAVGCEGNFTREAEFGKENYH